MKILFYNKAVCLSFLLSLTLPLQAMDSELPLKHAVKKSLISDVFEEQKAEKLKYTFEIQCMPSETLSFIFSFVTQWDILRAQRVSKNWRTII